MFPTITLEKREGRPIPTGTAVEVVPVSHVVRLRLLGGRMNAIWNRPAGVRVRAQGSERWLPVRDVTRRAQLGIWATALAVIGLVEWQRRKQNRDWRREVRR